MGAERFDNFVGGSYSALTPNLAADTCVNLYYESAEAGTGKNRAALMGAPGHEQFTALPTAPVRGVLVGEDLFFVVAGSRYYQVFDDGTFTDRGDVGDDAGHSPVQMFENGTQIMIVSAGLVYIDDGLTVDPANFQNGSGTVDTAGTAVTWVSGSTFDVSNVGNTIVIAAVSYTVLSVADSHHLTLTTSAGTNTAAAYGASYAVTASCGAYLDGYYIVAVPGTAKIQISAIKDGKSWNPLDFAIKEAYADGIQALLADHEQLWMMGDKTCEVWQDTGAAAFPLQRIQGAFVQMGICAPGTAVKFDGTVAWLGGDARGRAVAYAANGWIPTRISTHAVESAWRLAGPVGDATTYTYSDDGHEFLVINFPAANATWVYDGTAKLWHQRGWWNGTGLDKVRGATHGFVFDHHVVGDWQTGQLFYMATSIYSDLGKPIYHERAAPHVSGPMLGLAQPSGTSTNSPFQNNETFYSRFILDMEAGLGSGGALSFAYTMAWTNQTVVTVHHGLGTLAVCIEVMDTAGLVVAPEEIIATDANTCLLTFGAPFSGSVMVVAGAPGTSYRQAFAGTTGITITHGLGTTDVIVQVFNVLGLAVTPETTTVVDANHVILTFMGAIGGSVVVIKGSYMASWVGQTAVIATHGLGTTAVEVQCYDSTGLQVQPESMRVSSANTVTLAFAAAFSGSVVVWAGLSLATPFIILDWSDDGGHTFGIQHPATTGAVGEFAKRVVWRRLGKSRDRVFRVRYLASGKVAWINAYLESTAGSC
jgi:hypothetical protein